MSLLPFCFQGWIFLSAAHFEAALFALCCRWNGPAEGTALRLPGLRGSHASRPPQQQAGQPGTHLQALEMEEKEKWEAEALGKWVWLVLPSVLGKALDG